MIFITKRDQFLISQGSGRLSCSIYPKSYDIPFLCHGCRTVYRFTHQSVHFILNQSDFSSLVFQLTIPQLKEITETTIRKLPESINKDRNLKEYQDVYTTLQKLQDLQLVPKSGALEELLIRNPLWYDVAYDLQEILVKIWQSGKNAAAAFIASPYVFTVFW